jgi:hypothetical protein
MAKFRARQPRRAIPRRGFCTYNALAFNTLLSSQETDTHHRGASAPPPGQPLNLTPQYPPCQPRFLELSRMLRTQRSCGHPQFTPANPASDRREAPVGGCSVVPRGPSCLAAFSPPRGMKNSTAARNLRQIRLSGRRRGTCGRYTDTEESPSSQNRHGTVAAALTPTLGPVQISFFSS